MKWPVIVFLLTATHAHSTNRYEYWSKLNLQFSVHKKWLIATDFQYRSQSNYLQSHKNVFEHTLLYSGRLWVTYKPNKTEYLLSPFAYFNSFDYSIKDNDLHGYDEIRQAIGAQRQFELQKLKYRFRTLLEYRHQFYPNLTDILRVRFQIQAIQTILKKPKFEIGVILMDEYFEKLAGNGISMDNNRLYGGLQIKKNRHDIVLAFQWMQQKNVNTLLHRYQPHTTLNLRF
jgi:hypothetical protein